MKYLIAIVIMVNCVGSTQLLNAQALHISPGDTVVYTASLSGMDENSSGVAQFCAITNNSGHNDTVCWKVAQLTMNPGWQSMSLCDPNNCYLFYGNITNGTMHQFVLPADSSSNVDFTSTPQCVADTGYLQALFWLKNDSAASATNLLYIPVYTGVCGTAVQQIQVSQLKIYPTPVSSVLTIDGLNGLKNVRLTVYDMLGNIACEKYIEQPYGSTTINTSMLQSGVYVVTIDNNGTRLLTKRIQKLD